jgi:glycosyltransferase involved in cell wall biosynthesis
VIGVAHAVLVHDNFEGPTGMGLVAGRHASWLLEAGWTLTLVGENVPADLAAACRVVRVPAPRQLPSMLEHLGWCARARRVLRGLAGDVVHVHSPHLARDADLLTTHFIAAPAHSRGVRELSGGVEGGLRRLQAEINWRLDDRAYRHLGPRTRVSFVSEFLRDEFVRHYGPPRGGWVLAPPAPAWNPPHLSERERARRRFGVPNGRLAVGYVGGSDPRKGYFHLESLAGHDDVQLLVAGPGSERLAIDGKPGLGFVDVPAFFAACDVVVAPAAFDSAPMAVLQAVARDVAVVATPLTGWAKALERTGAGVVWSGGRPLIEAVRQAAQGSSESREAFTDEFSEARQKQALLSAFAEVLEHSRV